MKTECLFFYLQTDLYAENNDLMRLLTNWVLTSLGLEVLFHHVLGQMLLWEFWALSLWASASSLPVNVVGHRTQKAHIPVWHMLWAKLTVLHGNHSKSTSHLPYRFLLPLLINIGVFPLKSKWLWMYTLWKRPERLDLPLLRENKAERNPIVFTFSKSTLYVRI